MRLFSPHFLTLFLVEWYVRASAKPCTLLTMYRSVVVGASLLTCCLVCVYTVSSGSVTVNADSSVQLLAEEAVPLDQLDVAVSILWIPCTNSSVSLGSISMS